MNHQIAEDCPFEMDQDVIFHGNLEKREEDAGRNGKITDEHFWCVWKNLYLVGKVQQGAKVFFRIIDLKTMTYKVTRIPIDRKLLRENGTYTQLFYLYRDSILNLAILDSCSEEENLVFVEYDLNTCLTTFHPALRVSSRNFVQEMTLQNTIVRGKYFYFIRKVIFDISTKTLHAEVFRYNLEKKGQFRCISKLPYDGNFQPGFVKIIFDAIETDRVGIILFGVRKSRCFAYSEQIALLDVARKRWTLFPDHRNESGVHIPPYTTLERTAVSPIGGDVFFIKRVEELELWKRNMFTQTAVKLAKINSFYVELIHCVDPDHILIVTRQNDKISVLRKARNPPKSLAQMAADVVRRHNLQGKSNAELKVNGLSRKFLHKLLK